MHSELQIDGLNAIALCVPLQLSQLPTLIILKAEVAVVQARPFLYWHWHPWYVLRLFIAHFSFSIISLQFLYNFSTISLLFLFYFSTISLRFLYHFSTISPLVLTPVIRHVSFHHTFLFRRGSIHRISKAQARCYNCMDSIKAQGASLKTGRDKICLEIIWRRTWTMDMEKGIGHLGRLKHESERFVWEMLGAVLVCFKTS